MNGFKKGVLFTVGSYLVVRTAYLLGKSKGAEEEQIENEDFLEKVYNKVKGKFNDVEDEE